VIEAVVGEVVAEEEAESPATDDLNLGDATAS
jgi:hypothetical protein